MIYSAINQAFTRLLFKNSLYNKCEFMITINDSNRELYAVFFHTAHNATAIRVNSTEVRKSTYLGRTL